MRCVFEGGWIRVGYADGQGGGKSQRYSRYHWVSGRRLSVGILGVIELRREGLVAYMRDRERL
jgi:hypothetical protein